MYCNKCGNKLADGTALCEKCGNVVEEASREDRGNANQPQKVQTYRMINKYKGEPFLGYAKATGTLLVYPEHLEFKKLSDNAILGLGGGMIVAALKAKKEGKVEYYSYSDIKDAYVGKYAGFQPTVVIVMNDGRKFSFTGTLTKQTASSIVETVLSCRSNV